MSSKERETAYYKLAAAVPKAPDTLTNDDVVAQLMREMRATKSSSISPSSLLVQQQQPPVEVNKLYLANTIRSVEAHNRREEVEDCWREHKMQREADRRFSQSRTSEKDYSSSGRDTSSGKRRSELEHRSGMYGSSVSSSGGSSLVESEREVWAKRKVSQQLLL